MAKRSKDGKKRSAKAQGGKRKAEPGPEGDVPERVGEKKGKPSKAGDVTTRRSGKMGKPSKAGDAPTRRSGKRGKPSKAGDAPTRRSGKKAGKHKGGRRKRKDIEYIEENIYSQADDIIYDKIESKGRDAVRDLVSDEVFNPAGTEVVEYGEAKTFDFSDTTKEFALDEVKVLDVDPLENVKVLDIEKTVKVIDVDGRELAETETRGKKGRRGRRRKGRNKRDRPKRRIIDESKLEFDPMEQIQEYKKNWDEYQLKCRTCQNSRRCQVCQGTGRRFILLKCKNCNGTGECPDCHKTYRVRCEACTKKMLNYSPRCLECGHENRCPTCFTPLPVAATTCIVCRTKFICRRCKLPVAPGFEKRCPRCDAKIEQALY